MIKNHDVDSNLNIDNRINASYDSLLTRRWSGVPVLDLPETAGGTSLSQIMRHVSWDFYEWAFFPRFKPFYV